MRLITWEAYVIEVLPKLLKASPNRKNNKLRCYPAPFHIHVFCQFLAYRMPRSGYILPLSCLSETKSPKLSIPQVEKKKNTCKPAK